MYVTIHQKILKFCLGVLYKMINYAKRAIHLLLLFSLDHWVFAFGFGSLALLYLLADVVCLEVFLKGNFLMVRRSDHLKYFSGLLQDYIESFDQMFRPLIIGILLDFTCYSKINNFVMQLERNFLYLFKQSQINNLRLKIKLMNELDQKHGERLKKSGILSYPLNCYQSLGYLSLAAEYLPNDLQTLQWKIKCLFELEQYDICLKNMDENQYQSQEIQKIEFQIYLEKADFGNIRKVSNQKLRIENSATRQLYKTLKKIARFYKDYGIYKRNGDTENAVSSMESLIPLFPSQAVKQKLMNEIIDLLISQGDLKKVIGFLDKCPITLLTCTKRILYYSYLLQEQKCMQLIKEGNEKFPKNIEIQEFQRKICDLFFHYKMSKLCFQYKKYSEVVRACNEGLKIDQENTKMMCLLRFNRGKAQKYLGNRQQALQDFHATLDVDKGFIECIQQRIYIYVQLKKYRLAIYQYQTLKAKNPGNLATYDQRIKEIQQLELKAIKQGETSKIITILPMEQFNPPHSQQRDKNIYEDIVVPQGEEQYGQYYDEEYEQDQYDQQEQTEQEQYEEYPDTLIDDPDDYCYDPDIRVSVQQHKPSVQFQDAKEDW